MGAFNDKQVGEEEAYSILQVACWVLLRHEKGVEVPET